jgi:predicted ATP-grasp superfamily ATP-dependent carboligase
MRILITDGNERSALAAARSLLLARHTVFVAAPTRWSLAGASRGTEARLLPVDALADPAGFAAAVARLAEDERIDLLLPLTDAAAEAVLEHRAQLPPRVALPFPDLATYRKASDKASVLTLARACGFGIPETRVVATAADAARAIPEPGFFPAFVKPHRSVVGEPGRRRKLGVTPVADPAACRRALAAFPAAAYPVLLQRRVTGVGEGFFALRWGGRTVAMFAHRRLREKPPGGGVSVYRESIPLTAQLVEPGVRLLDALNWQGVAMVECKREPETGHEVIMEINGRFWGSLQLAVDAGVDFPALLARCAAGERVPETRAYQTGIRSRWFWGDVDHLYLRLTRARAALHLGDDAGSRLEALRDFLKIRRRDRSEVWRWRDPGPFLVESLQWLGLLAAHGRSSPAHVLGDPLCGGGCPGGRSGEQAHGEGRVVTARPEHRPHREAGRPA